MSLWLASWTSSRKHPVHKPLCVCVHGAVVRGGNVLVHGADVRVHSADVAVRGADVHVHGADVRVHGSDVCVHDADVPLCAVLMCPCTRC